MALSPSDLEMLTSAEQTALTDFETKIDAALPAQFDPGEDVFVYEVSTADAAAFTPNVGTALVNLYEGVGWARVVVQNDTKKYIVFIA